MQPGSRAGEISFFGNGHEIAHVAQFHRWHSDYSLKAWKWHSQSIGRQSLDRRWIW
jgi:hypothetical protein